MVCGMSTISVELATLDWGEGMGEGTDGDNGSRGDKGGDDGGGDGTV